MDRIISWLPDSLLQDGWSPTGEEFAIGIDLSFLWLVATIGVLVAAVHTVRRVMGSHPERNTLPEVAYSKLEPKAHAMYERVFLWGPLRNIFYQSYDGERIERYQPGQRLYYFAVAVASIVLLISGLALLQDGLLGSAPLISWVSWHVIGAAVIIVGLIAHVGIAVTVGDFWGMGVTRADAKRFGKSVKQFFGGGSELPRYGKYSPTVKILHWSNAILMLVLIVSGIIMLRTIDMPWWAATLSPFGLSESAVALTYVFHGVAAGLWVGVAILHLYFAVHSWDVSRSIFNGTLSRETFEQYYDPMSWRPDNVSIVANDGGEQVSTDEPVQDGDTHE